jgi:hypothetical protein
VDHITALTEMKFPADAFGPTVIAEAARVIAATWDPSGQVLSAALVKRPLDAAEPRSYSDYAIVLCGIAAAGGSQAAVMGYLRTEEETLLGKVVSSGSDRGAAARGVWKAVGRLTRREMLHGEEPDTGGVEGSQSGRSTEEERPTADN